MWGKDYEVLMVVHTNTDSVHTHFVVNSVSLKTGEKFCMRKEQFQRLRRISDYFCKMFNKSVLPPDRKYGRSKGYYWNKINGRMDFELLALSDVQEILTRAYSMYSFKAELQRYGYSYDEDSSNIKSNSSDKFIILNDYFAKGTSLYDFFERNYNMMSVSEINEVTKNYYLPRDSLLSEYFSMKNIYLEHIFDFDNPPVKQIYSIANVLFIRDNKDKRLLSPELRIQENYKDKYSLRSKILFDLNIKSIDELKESLGYFNYYAKEVKKVKTKIRKGIEIQIPKSKYSTSINLPPWKLLKELKGILKETRFIQEDIQKEILLEKSEKDKYREKNKDVKIYDKKSDREMI